MKKIKLAIFVILIFSVLSLNLRGQEVLDRYLTTAAENNPGLKARFNEYLAALEIAPQVHALPDPQVAFGYFIQPVETRLGPQRAKISVSQVFPWFGRLQANEAVAVQKAKAKYELFEDAKSRLFYEVSSSYFSLYFLNRAIRITNDNMDILRSFKDLALIKLEGGMVSGVNELRIEMEIADLENQLALLRDRYFSIAVQFENLLNSKIQGSVEFPDTLWNIPMPFNKQNLMDSIRFGNHQLSALDYELNALQNKEVAAKKAGAPGFSIGIDYIITGQGDNAALTGKDAIVFPKIGITIPLYRKKYSAMIRETVYLQKAVEEKKIDKTNILETVFENSWKDYRDADRRLGLYGRQTGFATQALQLLETEYATQNKNFEEILRMERRVLKYALELEKARADKNAAIAFTKYLIGR